MKYFAWVLSLVALFFSFQGLPEVFWDTLEHEGVPNHAIIQVGLINASGEWVLDPSMDSLEKFGGTDSRLIAWKKGKASIIAPSTKSVYGKSSWEGVDRVSYFRPMARVKLKDLFGYISSDPPAQFAIYPKFTKALSFGETYALSSTTPLYEDNRNTDLFYYAYYDAEGNEKFAFPVSVPELEDHYWEAEGLAPFYCENRNGWGFTDLSGAIQIPCKFFDVQGFSEGLAAVKDTNDQGQYRWGFINKVGKVQIDFQFDGVEPFRDGYALVHKEGEDGSFKYQLIDKQGRSLTKESFSSVSSLQNGYSVINIEKINFGFVSKNGQLTWLDQYQIVFLCDFVSLKGELGAFSYIKDSAGNYFYGYFDPESRFQPLNLDFAKSISPNDVWRAECPVGDNQIPIHVTKFERWFDRETFAIPDRIRKLW